jgi:hypothetical protein
MRARQNYLVNATILPGGGLEDANQEIGVPRLLKVENIYNHFGAAIS